MASVYSLFDSLTAATVPVNRPSGGTTYLFRWSEDSKSEDWRADGYRWRQGGVFKNHKCAGGVLHKTYFQVSRPIVFLFCCCRFDEIKLNILCTSSLY